LNGLEHLYNLASEYNVDFVRYRLIRSGWPGLPEHAPCMLETPREMSGGYYDKKKIINEIYPRLLATPEMTFGPILGACGALYKHSFLRQNEITFCEDIKYSEDVLFSANVVKYANDFYYDDIAGVYHYFYNNESISKSFRADRWESCKMLIKYAHETFRNDNTFDFSNQLNILTWFCIMLALNERRNITDRVKRREYCKMVVNDEVVRQCELNKKRFHISLKQYFFMQVIKKNLWWLLAEV